MVDLPLNKRDDYDNLILLCRIHHKLIDDQPNTFSSVYLRTKKKEHETWVQKSLSSGLLISSSVFPAFRIDNGKQLLDLLIGCDASVIENDQVLTQAESDSIGSLTQDIHDYIDMWSDISQRDRIQAQLDLHEQITQLSNSGFLVYSCNRRQKLNNEEHNNSIIFNICYILIIRVTNRLTNKKDNTIEEIFKCNGQVESNFSNFVFFVCKNQGIHFI